MSVRVTTNRSLGVIGLAFATLVTPRLCTAQASLLLVNGETEVEDLRFSFLDHQTFRVDRLRDRIALRAPGSFDFLPLVSSGPLPFTPLELQRDVARLRLFYVRSGFPEPHIDYVVRFNATSNKVAIEFLIQEGDARVRGSLAALDDAGAETRLSLPPELQAPWATFLTTVTPREGERLGDLEQAQLEDRLSAWLRDRGYPVAHTTVELSADSVRAGPEDVVARVQTGPRAVVGSVLVEGTNRLTPSLVTRELPFARGDVFSAQRVSEGERELFGLDLVRLALVDVIEPVSADSIVDLRVRVEENLPRVISGQVGYATEAGLLGQVDWAHRSFFGGARTLSVSLQGRTGTLVVGPDFQRRYAASTSVKQPYFFGRRRSLVVTPQVEYRDDFRDRSVQGGAEAVVIHQWGQLRTASAHLSVSRRHVLDFRLTGNEGFDFRDVLADLDSLDHDVRTASLGISFSWGAVDNPIVPRDGYIARAAGEVTGPSWTSSAQYTRLEASLARFVPLSPETGLTLRVAGGRLLPFGRSVPANADGRTGALLRLRDAIFTAGGRYDVRGWGEQQLGPKFPDVRLETAGADTVLVAERYVPLGGLARAMASAELRLPLPGAASSHSTHVFVDAGRIWTPDDRFTVAGIGDVGESEFRFSVGGGIELGTPVGLFRLSAGYKLNPSLLDVRDPQAVFAAMSAGRAVSGVPTRTFRRWHIHLAIGQVY